MSPEHYTKATESVTAWCNKCERTTTHAVSGHRIGRCMEHQAEGESKKQMSEKRKREFDEKNPRLF